VPSNPMAEKAMRTKGAIRFMVATLRLTGLEINL
jgi:hypothetical protein